MKEDKHADRTKYKKITHVGSPILVALRAEIIRIVSPLQVYIYNDQNPGKAVNTNRNKPLLLLMYILKSNGIQIVVNGYSIGKIDTMLFAVAWSDWLCGTYRVLSYNLL